MNTQTSKGNRVDWGSLSPLLERERLEKASHTSQSVITALEQLQAGGRLATRRVEILCCGVRQVPAGRLLDLKVKPSTVKSHG